MAAPELITSLDDCAGAAADRVGMKARTLGRLIASGLNVPTGVCLTTRAFRRFRVELDLDTEITEKLARARSVPATLGGGLADIRRAIRNTAFPDWLVEALARPVAELLERGPIAVRSSSPLEDDVTSSAAGVYDSLLNVSNTAEAHRAIAAVWASLFTERVNFYEHCNFGTDMAVVLQHQVDADFTGVLFTRHPLTGERQDYIEVSTDSEAVTSGNGVVRASDGIDLRQIAEFCEKVVGGPADIEFAISAGLVSVLQARPLVGSQGVALADAQWARQEDIAAVRELPLGHCQQRFMRQLVKHVPYRQVCRSLDLPIFDIYYLAYPWDRLGSPAIAQLLDRLDTPYVRLNWGTSSRTLVARDQLLDALWDGRLANVVGESTSCVQVGTVIPATVTGFAAPTQTGRIFVEAFPAGMSGLKSGAVQASTYLLGADGAVLQEDPRRFGARWDFDPASRTGWARTDLDQPWLLRLDPDILRELARFTTALAERLGEVRLEWYAGPDGVTVKDLSIEQSALLESARVLSPGSAEGPVLIVDDLAPFDQSDLAGQISVTEHADHTDLIERTQELRSLLDAIGKLPRPPVVVAAHPSLGLIPLIPHVAGFVFTSGNLLCHTAIVLRERGTPAYVIPTAMSEVTAGRDVVVAPSGLRWVG